MTVDYNKPPFKMKKVSDLKPGDMTPWYKVLSLQKINQELVVDVRFNDGGTSKRSFDDLNQEVPTLMD
jgi:hypothetical protein